MLRLGKDQECYDFVKWWSVVSEQSDYDWGDMNLPFLDIMNADVFEPCDQFCQARHTLELRHAVSLILLKIKLLLELTALDNSTLAVGAKEPREILNTIRPYILHRPLITEKLSIMSRDTHASEINRLAAQVNALYVEISEMNRHFWSSLNEFTTLGSKHQGRSNSSKRNIKLRIRLFFKSAISLNPE
jgi:hypothetical protein